MRSYCVKQKKQTECIPNSEKIMTTSNGRTMEKCICAECGITKTKFVKSPSRGKGVGETINKKIGSEIPGFQQAQDIAKILIPDKQLFDKYWSGDIAKGAFNTKTGLFSKKFWTHPSEKQDPSCNKIVYDKKSGKWVNKYCD